MTFDLPDLPEGWSLAALIHLDPEWQVNLRDGLHIASATGDTPSDACAAALAKAAAGQFTGFKLTDFAPAPQAVNIKGLLQNLGFAQRKPFNLRRL